MKYFVCTYSQILHHISYLYRNHKSFENYDYNSKFFGVQILILRVQYIRSYTIFVNFTYFLFNAL